MRIGIDARTIFSPQPRGTGRNLFDVYRLIPELRPEWTFHLYHQRGTAVCPLVCGGAESEHDAPFAWPANVTARHIDIPGDRLDLWFQLRLPIAAWRDRLDLLHLPANAAPAWRPVPTVVTVHDLAPLKLADELPRRARAAFRRGMLRAIRGALRIITPSAATRDELCGDYGLANEGLANERVTVIPWAPDRAIGSAGPLAQRELERVRRRYQLGRPWLLNFSGESRRKNAAGLLAAFAQLPADFRTACDLALAGCSAPGFRATLASLAERLGIAGHCRLLGFVPHSDLPYLLGGAQALLMPSLAEGFGLPILDAFACGVPVLTSNCSSMPEVAGEAAVYCDPTSPASIAAAILRVLQPQVARELVARGQQRVRQFTWERTAAAMCAVYERCLLETGRMREPRRARHSEKQTAGRCVPASGCRGTSAVGGREIACR
jgi:glycosyltransferase involved in cell wall biosynthesis